MRSEYSEIVALLKVLIAEKIGCDANSISETKSFFSLGVTSLISEEILLQIGSYFGEVSTTLMFEKPNIKQMASYLEGKQTHQIESDRIKQVTGYSDYNRVKTIEVEQSKDTKPGTKRQRKQNKPVRAEQMDIAIIGVSGQFPESSNLNEFWENLLNKKDCIKQIPESRWDYLQLFSEDAELEASIYSKWGSFLDGIEYFDPLFFHISHREAENLDPQQKLFLQCAWRVMEDAGYANIENRPTNNIGVFVGVTWNEFSVLSHQEKSFSGGGSLYWGIPNRTSYFLNFTGPSKAIDTACSSSLVAIHDACKSLIAGECEMVIAGGVNLNLHPNKYLFLSQNHFLSSEGKCRSFGEGGDGYVPGEGVGAVLLKPLDKAMADNDYIYGVIKGSATNHGGKVTGYTVPNPTAHRDLILSALTNAELEASDIDYVECHGTGTALGDPIEITGLSQAFKESTNKKQFCGIGSVKSSIGHLEAAAGIAGLIKILLCMKHGKMVGSLHASVENKKINFSDSPFYLIKETQELELSDNKVFTTGISSFGAGGSNAHIIVQSFVNRSIRQAKQGKSWVTLSAESQAQLMDYVKSFTKAISSLTNNDKASQLYTLRNIANSLSKGRQHFSQRLLVAATSLTDLNNKLQGFINKAESDKDVYYGFPNKTQQSKIESLKKNTDSNKAELWVFSLLDEFPFHVDEVFQKVPLPNYPFKKERSWVSSRSRLVEIELSSNKQGVVHPLIDQNISTLKQQKFSKQLARSDYYLRDHLVADEHVIPGVCHLEIALASAKLAIESDNIILRDIWFSNVISVKQDSCRIEIEFLLSRDTIEFQIRDSLERTIYSRGKVAYRENENLAGSGAAPLLEKVDLESIKARLNESWSIDSVYARFLRMAIIQKKTFQVIHNIQFDRNEALARVALDASLQQEFSQYSLHPTLMDGAVQTSMMLLQYVLAEEIIVLPFYFGEVTQLKPLTSSIYVHARLIDKKNKSLDIDIYDEEGVLLVVIKQFILKEMVPDELHSTNKTHQKNKLGRLENILEEAGQQNNKVESLPYYVTTLIESPFINSDTGANKQQSILVFCRDKKQFELLSKATEFKNAHLTPIYADSNYSRLTDNGFTLEPGNYADYEALCRDLNAIDKLPDNLLVLWGVDDFETVTEHTSPIEERLNRSGRSLFLLVKSLLKITKKLNIVYVSYARNDHFLPEQNATSGLFKTLKIEKPSFTGRVVSLDREALAKNLATIVYKEFNDASAETDIFWQAGKRYVRRFEHLKSPDENSFLTKHSDSSGFVRNGVYLISGGMGGLGLIVSKYLSEKYQASVVLLGRSKIDQDKQKTLQAISQLGGNAIYLDCDISNGEQVNASIEKTLSEFGCLNGVIHSAGVIEDDFILKKSPESFEQVINPKIMGCINLDHATKDINLDFFMLFSSVTAVLGNLGQSDYGYANAFLDYFAQFRNQQVNNKARAGQTVSINWPYWKQGGMSLTEKEESVLTSMFGFIPLENLTGLKAIEDILLLPNSQVAVLDGNEAKIYASLGIEPAEPAQPIELNAPGEGEVRVLSDENYKGLKARIESYIKEIFAKQLKIPIDRLDSESSFEKYGLDSIVMIELIGVMEKRFKGLPKTLLFEYQTIVELTQYFIENYADSFSDVDNEVGATYQAEKSLAVIQSERGANANSLSQLESNNPFVNGATSDEQQLSDLFRQNRLTSLLKIDTAATSKKEPIAIIGMAGQYAQAANLDEFWNNLKDGRDCVLEIPEDRWDSDNYFSANIGKRNKDSGKSYSKWGSFINDVDKFDAQYFHISPKEAKTMDPQERLFLQNVTKAIEDAGYHPDKLDFNKANRSGMESTNSVGVFVGCMWGDYQLHTADSGGAFEQTPQSFYWSIANRVSYYYNFSGPSFTVDSACSSSFTALQLACDSLHKGEVSVAIAGAVNLSLHPQKYSLLSRMKLLSSEGKCRTFGDGGDGYVPGEGIGSVILKPLSQAIKDKDNIYGVIRSTSLNHGGKTSGFTVPNPKAQANLINQAISGAGLSPAQINYLEAHGTGTDLGDPIELSGLNRSFSNMPRGSIPIGSVKTNYGHLEAAAGMIALTKVLLQFKHKTIVPSIHSEILNTKINFEESAFYVQRECQPWQPRNTNKRIAGISSFGAGGTNAHVILEEPPVESISGNNDIQHIKNTHEIFVFSAKSKDRLLALLADYVSFLTSIIEQRKNLIAPLDSRTTLENISFTLMTGRIKHESRLAIVVSSFENLLSAITGFISSQKDAENIFYSENAKAKTAEIILKNSAPIEQWIQQRALKSLALAWSAGIAFDAQALYKHGQCYRLSLPTYPFAKDSYWIDDVGTRGQHSVAMLLDENISTLQQQQFRKLLRSTDALLTDHLVKNNQIYPAAAQLEMAREAIVLSTGKATCLLTDLTWISPIICNEGELEIYVRLFKDTNGGWVDICSLSNQVEKVYMYGRFILEPENNSRSHDSETDNVEPALVNFDVPTLLESLDKKWNQDDYYRLLKECGLEYGDNFLETVEASSNSKQSLVKLAVPESQARLFGGDSFPPALVDGAFRAAIVIGSDESKFEFKVPVSIQSFRISRPLTDGVFAYAELHADKTDTFDIRILDKNGVCLAQMESLLLKTISPPQFKSPSKAKSLDAKVDPVVVDYLLAAVAKVTKLPANKVSRLTQFADLGFDSIMSLELLEFLEKKYGQLSKTLLYEYENVNELAAYFTQEFGGVEVVDSGVSADLLDQLVREANAAAELPYKNTTRSESAAKEISSGKDNAAEKTEALTESDPVPTKNKESTLTTA